MADESTESPQRWTAKRRVALVLRWLDSGGALHPLNPDRLSAPGEGGARSEWRRRGTPSDRCSVHEGLEEDTERGHRPDQVPRRQWHARVLGCGDPDVGAERPARH